MSESEEQYYSSGASDQEEYDEPKHEEGLTPISIHTLPGSEKFISTSGRLLQLDHRGLAVTVAMSPQIPIPGSPQEQQDETLTEPGSGSNNSDKSNSSRQGDPADVDALKILEHEFGIGLLMSQEVSEQLNLLASGPHGKQLPQPSATLKSIEARSGPGKRQLALNLATTCKWGVVAVFAAIGAMDTAVTCVSAMNANSILGGLSELVDHLAIREAESRKQSQLFKESLDDITKTFNKSTETFAKCSSSAEQLLFTIQDVQSKVNMAPVNPPRSLSSMESRIREHPVEKIERLGTYRCEEGTLTMTKTGIHFSGIGDTSKLLSELASISAKPSIVMDLMNKKIPDLISFLDENHHSKVALSSLDAAEKLETYNRIMSEVEEGTYQWTFLASKSG